MRTALKLLATAGLGVFYLALPYAASHPRTSAEYRDHYSQRRADCWVPARLAEAGPDLPDDVAVGQLAYPQACLYLRIGWVKVEGWGAWSNPGPATLRLPWRPDATAAELGLRGPAAAPGPVRAEFTIGGEQVGVTVPPGEERSVRIPLPPAPDRRAWEVRLRVEGVGTAPTGLPFWPTRRVGVGLERIRYLGAGSDLR
jgi:hypothetical protein